MGAANFGAKPGGYRDTTPITRQGAPKSPVKPAENNTHVKFFEDAYGRATEYGDKVADYSAEAAKDLNRAGQYAWDIGEQGAAGMSDYAKQAGNLSDLLGTRATDVMGRAAPTLNYGQAQGLYGAAQGNALNLANLEATQGPSAAQAQLQSGLNQAQASNLALARSGRGWGGNAQALAQAQNQNVTMGQNAANQAAMLRAGEDAAWRQRQASNLMGAGEMQTNLGAQYQNQTQFGGDLALRQQALNDQTMLGLTDQQRQSLMGAGNLYGQGVGMEFQGSAMDMAAQQAANQTYLGGLGTQYGAQTGVDALNMQKYGIDQGVAIGNAQNNQAMVGAGIGGTATLLAALLPLLASDERAKTDIDADPDAAREAVRAAPGSFYKYKDPSIPGAGPGKKYGPMAQDLERTPAGRTVVVNAPNGTKMVDTGRLSMLNTAALASMDAEIADLRKALRKQRKVA